MLLNLTNRSHSCCPYLQPIQSNALRQSMASIVFWQSFWYLISFYLTWPPYLALQYLWAAGSGYSNYGFTLFACTLVPLQGFWNCFVFFRVRAKKGLSDSLSFVSRSLSRRFSRPVVSNVSGDESPGIDMNQHVVVDKAVEVVESTTVKDSNRIPWSDKTNQAHESFQSNSMPSAGLGTVDDDDKNDTISINDDDQVKVMPEAA